MYKVAQIIQLIIKQNPIEIFSNIHSFHSAHYPSTLECRKHSMDATIHIVWSIELLQVLTCRFVLDFYCVDILLHTYNLLVSILHSEQIITWSNMVCFISLFFSQACDIILRACDILLRACDILLRACDIILQVCDIILLACYIIQRACDILLVHVALFYRHVLRKKSSTGTLPHQMTTHSGLTKSALLWVYDVWKVSNKRV